MCRFALLTAVLLLGGCQLTEPAQPDLAFRTDRDAYQPGDALELILENETGVPYGYNLCTSGLERRTDAGWVRAPQPDGVCILPLYRLAPGQTATYTKTLREDLPPGTYRYLDTFENLVDGARRQWITNTFEVR